MLARQSGDLDSARAQTAFLERVLPGMAPSPNVWLAWAAMFCVAMAAGEGRAAPPVTPPEHPEPVAQVASWIVRAELVLAGRLDEVSRPAPVPDRHRPLSVAEAVLEALSLVLVGEHAAACEHAAWAVDASVALGSVPMERAARALLAEATRDRSALPARPASALSVSDVVVLRAHAALGDTAARDPLKRGAQRLAVPALGVLSSDAETPLAAPLS
jgi:hypothetical protein